MELPNHEIRRIKGIVIGGTCDLPAKALILNMKQFNGEYRCQKCTIKTEQAEGSTARIYPFRINLPLRTQEQTDRFAQEAHESGEAIYGVKGPSAISLFVPNYIRATVIDSIHCVYSGVVAALLTLWFSPQHANQTWSLSRFANIVNKKRCSITPPEFVTRLPRSLTDHAHHLKANELKTWLLYQETR